MTWTKLDDNIYDNPKMVKAGEDAADLYVRALVYCNKHLTDGRIEAEVLGAITRKRNSAKLAADLVRVGAWETHPEGGWMVHDFHDHNPTAEEVMAKRAELSAKRSEAGKLGGMRSGERRSNEAKLKQAASVVSKQTASNGEANEVEATKQTSSNRRTPVPSRPVPEEGEGDARPPAPAREETPQAPAPTPPAPARLQRQPPRDTPWLDALRRAAADHAVLTGAASLTLALDDVLANHAPSDAVIAAMGAAFADTSPWWPGNNRPKNKRPTINDLAGFDPGGGPGWKPLAALVAHAQEVVSARAGRAALPPPSQEPRPRPVFTEETAKKFERFTSARRAEEETVDR